VEQQAAALARAQAEQQQREAVALAQQQQEAAAVAEAQRQAAAQAEQARRERQAQQAKQPVVSLASIQNEQSRPKPTAGGVAGGVAKAASSSWAGKAASNPGPAKPRGGGVQAGGF
jgi:hypothetical protein